VIPANQDGVDPTAIGREFATTVTANITTSELEASPAAEVNRLMIGTHDPTEGEPLSLEEVVATRGTEQFRL